jgi:hypothetical protein
MRDKMKDKLIDLLYDVENARIDTIANYLIANNVFVLPEKMKDSWELALPFMMRLFVTDEEEIAKIKAEFELSKKKKILTDIRDYLLNKEKSVNRFGDVGTIMSIGICEFVKTALDDLTEYAEKLGVEL